MAKRKTSVPDAMVVEVINELRKTLSLQTIATSTSIGKSTLTMILSSYHDHSYTSLKIYNKLIRLRNQLDTSVMHIPQKTCGNPSIENYLHGCRCQDCRFIAHREKEKRELLKRKAEKSKGTFRAW